MNDAALSLLKGRELERGPQGAAGRSKQHWRLTRGEDGVAWLLFDRAGESVNTLSEEAIRELDALLSTLESDPPKGLVIRSAKPSGFIAGADIRGFRDVESEDVVRERMISANETVDRLAGLSFPTVALIHGFCLGGGFEIALACDYRIAIAGARFGFPEVKLGLHPGLGGTARLTRLIDPTEAMKLMLTGKTVHAEKAKKLGVIDVITEERHAAASVKAAISGDIKKTNNDFRKTAMNAGPARAFAARQMEAKTAERAPRAHYPAPHALIDLWKDHGGDFAAMKKAETDSFSRLLLTETAQNLIRVYFLRENLKKQADKDASGVRHVHVIGAGAMGGDIAGWCALKGLAATVEDIAIEQLADAVKRAVALCKDKHLSRNETRETLDRLIPDPAGDGVRHADLVLEAAPERKALKQKIYADIEPKMKDGAILATNTSSIPLETLAGALGDPTRLVGLHFFNPVSRMEVVEVVAHDGASEESLKTARNFVGSIDKLPAPVASAPGFLVNRALMPYLMEALVMLDEGMAKESIDRAAEEFGMPMGPITLADQVGLDICLDVAEMLSSSVDEPMAEIPGWLRDKVENGNLGRKTGKGLYDWKDGKAKKSGDVEKPPEDAADRLMLPMINICAASLRRGVVDSEDILDGAMIFATGFAPFRGGPMHYARNRGFGDIEETLQSLAERHGERFRPDAFWRDAPSV